MTVMSCIHVDLKAVSAKGSRQLLCCLFCVVWKLELVMQNFFFGGGKEAYLAYKTTTYCWYSWNIKSTARPGRLLQKERNNTAEMLIVNYLINIHFFQVILFFFILVMLTLPLILGVLPNVDNVSLGVTMVWLWFRGWLWWLTASLALHFGKQYWHITSKTTICGGVHVS